MTGGTRVLGMPMWLARIIALLAFGAVWELMARLGLINPLFIGNPVGIIVFFFKGLFVTHELVVHLLWTLAGTLAAFVLGSVTGILVGLLFVAYPRVEQFIDPIFAGLNALPRIALAPLFLLWFGLGISSKIALGFSLTFFIVLSSTIAGARSVNSDHLTLADTLGASSTQVFRRITLPSAVPTVFSGLRLGLIYALLGVIAGEIIAAQHGLGQSLTFLAGTFQINGVFAVLLLLALLGMSLTWIMTAIEARLLRWR
jgi:NitT/TauT family transport system permease protein